MVVLVPEMHGRIRVVGCVGAVLVDKEGNDKKKKKKKALGDFVKLIRGAHNFQVYRLCEKSLYLSPLL